MRATRLSPVGASITVADLTGTAIVTASEGLASSDNDTSVPTTAAVNVGLGSKVYNLIPTAVKTAAYTAAVNDLIPVDSSGGAFTITLPTAPADKSRVAVKKIDVNKFFTVTIAAGGSDVFNKASGPTTLSVSLQYQAVVLQYNASGGIWYVVSTDVPLGGLDTRYHRKNASHRLKEALSRPTQRMIYPAADAPTITFVDAPTNSQILTSTALFPGSSFAGIDVLGTGQVSLFGACNPQHVGAYPDTLQYRNICKLKDLLGKNEVYAYSLHFYTDSDKVELVWGNAAAGSYRVWVDDQVIGSLAPTTFTLTSHFQSLMIDFSATAAPTKVKRVRVDVVNGRFIGMLVNSSSSPTKYRIWPAEQRGPTVFAFGDSMFGGSGFTQASNQIPQILGDMFGWDNVFNLAQGGTGWNVKNAPSSFDNTSLPQVQYCAPSTSSPSTTIPGSAMPIPDIVLIEYGHNDAPPWTTQAQTNATATVAAARSQWPNALIIMFGPLADGSIGSAYISSETTAFANAAPYVDATISTIQGPNTPWLTGSGYSGATTGSGNGDQYIGSDGVHLVPAGVDYMSELATSAIRKLLV